MGATRGRVWVEISLSTLRDNFRKIRGAVAPCGVMAVLKANAYGLGVARVAEVLAAEDCAGFGVAELNEALALKGGRLPVQILGSVLPEEIPDAVDAGVVLPVTDLHTAQLISAEACRQGRTAAVHVLVDTGMGRLGVLASEAVEVATGAASLPGLSCEGIYSHFPVAYRSGSAYTEAQIDTFIAIIHALEARGVVFAKRHIANSDAINNFARACQAPFNLVRTGINLHGSFDMEGRRRLDLRSVLVMKTRLSAVRRLPAGTHIGYGCTYRLPRDMSVGTISAGYADGLPLALSNRGYVLIRGRHCHVLGRVSMDYTTVSLDQTLDAECGDEVVCLGGDGPWAIEVEHWAEVKGTHPYEIICSFGSRVERRFVE